MTATEKFSYLLKEYLKGNYTTRNCCELFCFYHRDLALPPISPETKAWVDNLDELCGRFSEFPEDHALCADTFVNENEIRAYMKTCSDEVLLSLAGTP